MRTLGLKRTMNFGFERTHVLRNELKRMFSPDFQVRGMLSKTENAWHASYVCILQLTKNLKQSKEQILLWRVLSIPSWLPSPTTDFFAVVVSLRHSLHAVTASWACLFYAARRSTVLCTCAFAVDTLHMYCYVATRGRQHVKRSTLAKHSGSLN